MDKKDDESIFGPEETCGSSKTTGLSICTAAIFIIGEICGAGALSFPMGLSKSGIYGKNKVEIGVGVRGHFSHLITYFVGNVGPGTYCRIEKPLFNLYLFLR